MRHNHSRSFPRGFFTLIKSAVPGSPLIDKLRAVVSSLAALCDTPALMLAVSEREYASDACMISQANTTSKHRVSHHLLQLDERGSGRIEGKTCLTRRPSKQRNNPCHSSASVTLPLLFFFSRRGYSRLVWTRWVKYPKNHSGSLVCIDMFAFF